jgi:hypothetical protein
MIVIVKDSSFDCKSVPKKSFTFLASKSLKLAYSNEKTKTYLGGTYIWVRKEEEFHPILKF